MHRQIALAEYLFQRIAQLGVRSVHGVPGDYNLTCLDYVYKTGLHWVGNANELSAGYAADGYARIKGISALVTSFGVGELSALNAIGGAYAEKSPVVHIVGTPPRAAQDARVNLHHSLGDGNCRAFAEIYKTFTVAQANLTDAGNATAQIDATLRQCIIQSRPVYIEIPTDMVDVRVQTWTSALDLFQAEYNEHLDDDVVATIAGRIHSAKQPLILVDGFAARFDVREDLNKLAKLTGFPVLIAPFGKGLIDEDLPNFRGTYLGSADEPARRSWVQNSDLVLHFGPLRSDVNTFGFTAVPDIKNTLTFDRYSVAEGEVTLPSHAIHGNRVDIQSILRKLLDRLRKTWHADNPSTFPGQHPGSVSLPQPDNAKISQDKFWHRISAFLRPGDVVLTETGTAAYGGQSLILPPRTTLINSFIWLSIGHMLGACQGVALAQRDTRLRTTHHTPDVDVIRHRGLPSSSDGRTILFIGDGSLQMTAQTISDIIRNKLDVIIFVLNNSGYTIERVIHGFHASYNDVQPWRNLKAPEYFGAPENDHDYPVRTRKVESWTQLDNTIVDTEIQRGRGLTMIEIVMDMEDCPDALQKVATYIKNRNRGETLN